MNNPAANIYGGQYNLYCSRFEIALGAFDICVCAKNCKEAKELIRQFLPDEMGYKSKITQAYRALKEQTNLDADSTRRNVPLTPREFARELFAESLKNFEVTLIKEEAMIPDIWKSAIPWGNNDFVDDRGCSNILKDILNVRAANNAITGASIVSIRKQDIYLIIQFNNDTELKIDRSFNVSFNQNKSR